MCSQGVVQESAWDHVAFVNVRAAARPAPAPALHCTFPAPRSCTEGYCSCTAGPPPDGETVLEIFEATQAGVHVYPLEERLARVAWHHTFVTVRRLQGQPTEAGLVNLEAFIQAVHGRAYEKHPTEMIHAACVNICATNRHKPRPASHKPGCCGGRRRRRRDQQHYRPTRPDETTAVAEPGAEDEDPARALATIDTNAAALQSIFCAELVAAALQALGVLQIAGVAANDFLPSDFAHDPGTISAAYSTTRTIEPSRCTASPGAV